MNIKNNNLLEKRIMRRVYSIWFIKKAMPRFIAELAMFSVFAYLIGRFVFVAKVLEYADQILANSSINPAVWTNFIFNTFSQTEFIVQLSVLGSLLAVVFAFKTFIASLVQLSMAKEAR
ncbi:MAG: hypothetical protein Q7J30_02355 [Candidatus Azambacteria bacterium]|nr:hypothetical protein [Candidatus Azambacteria bacterium]